MRDAGVDIESHTVSHGSLNAKKGKTDEQYLAWLKSEIVGSKETLEKNLGIIQVKAFAYPYGLHNETDRNIVKEAGLRGGFYCLRPADRVWSRSAVDRTLCHRLHKTEGLRGGAEFHGGLSKVAMQASRPPRRQ
jgi:peptidoglycan/xylan/chitin deacetylase (PgdA/CDA1 family)